MMSLTLLQQALLRKYPWPSLSYQTLIWDNSKILVSGFNNADEGSLYLSLLLNFAKLADKGLSVVLEDDKVYLQSSLADLPSDAHWRLLWQRLSATYGKLSLLLATHTPSHQPEPSTAMPSQSVTTPNVRDNENDISPNTRNNDLYNKALKALKKMVAKNVYSYQQRYTPGQAITLQTLDELWQNLRTNTRMRLSEGLTEQQIIKLQKTYHTLYYNALKAKGFILNTQGTDNSQETNNNDRPKNTLAKAFKVVKKIAGENARFVITWHDPDKLVTLEDAKTLWQSLRHKTRERLSEDLTPKELAKLQAAYHLHYYNKIKKICKLNSQAVDRDLPQNALTTASSQEKPAAKNGKTGKKRKANSVQQHKKGTKAKVSRSAKDTEEELQEQDHHDDRPANNLAAVLKIAKKIAIKNASNMLRNFKKSKCITHFDVKALWQSLRSATRKQLSEGLSRQQLAKVQKAYHLHYYKTVNGKGFTLQNNAIDDDLPLHTPDTAPVQQKKTSKKRKANRVQPQKKGNAAKMLRLTENNDAEEKCEENDIGDAGEELQGRHGEEAIPASYVEQQKDWATLMFFQDTQALQLPPTPATQHLALTLQEVIGTSSGPAPQPTRVSDVQAPSVAVAGAEHGLAEKQGTEAAYLPYAEQQEDWPALMLQTTQALQLPPTPATQHLALTLQEAVGINEPAPFAPPTAAAVDNQSLRKLLKHHDWQTLGYNLDEQNLSQITVVEADELSSFDQAFTYFQTVILHSPYRDKLAVTQDGQGVYLKRTGQGILEEDIQPGEDYWDRVWQVLQIAYDKLVTELKPLRAAAEAGQPKPCPTTRHLAIHGMFANRQAEARPLDTGRLDGQFALPGQLRGANN